MKAGKFFFAAAAAALVAALIWLKIIRQHGQLVLAPCPPELVLNGSFETGVFTGSGETDLNDANDCAKKDGACLDNLMIGRLPNNLPWFQTPAGLSGVPPDPMFDSTGGMDKRFINLSGQMNGNNNTGFPSVIQSIRLGPAIYELGFKLGQGSDDRFGRTKPVSAEVAITGAVTGKFPTTFTTDPNGGAWQDFMLRFGSNGGTIQLNFFGHPHANNVMGFIGLDNVSLMQLKPVPGCQSP